MNALLLMIATTAVSVEAGWLPLSDGGVEYIIQIEPNALDTLLRQSDVESEIPPNLDVRRVRITVGTAKLPRQNPPSAPSPAAGGTTGNSPGNGVSPPTNPPGSSDPSSSGTAPANENPNSISPLPAGAAPTPPATLGSSSRTGAGPRSADSTTPPTSPPFAAEAGPALGSPAASFADSERAVVAQVLDDPRAPGRNPYLAAEQPQLPNASSLAAGRNDLLAEAHAARRPPEERIAPSASNGQGPTMNGSNFSAPTTASGPTGNYGQRAERPSNDRPAGEAGASATAAGMPEPQERPWLFTVFLLLMSLSANVYLGWVAWDSRLRYRELLAQHDSLVGVV